MLMKYPQVESRDRVLQRMVIENMAIADAVANRFRSSSVDAHDLRQVAYVGLLKAVQRFDPESGAGLVAFAVPTITGEIKRYLRDSTWMVRPPRAVQELSLEIGGDLPTLAQRLRREPTAGDVARATGHARARIAEAMSCSRGRWALSLDAPAQGAEDEGPTLGELLPDRESEFERAELSMTLADALRKVPASEQEVVRLRYFHDLTQSEIARRIGVSQMQVSRLLRRALDALREHLVARGVHH